MNEVLQILGEGSLKELKELVAQLERAEQLIVDINEESKRIDFSIRGAKTLKDFAVNMENVRSNMDKMSAATNLYSKTITQADQAYSRLSASQQEEAMKTIKANEDIKRSIKERFDADKQNRALEIAGAKEAAQIQKELSRQVAAEKKRIADEERNLNRMIAAEEKVLLAKSNEERRAAAAERKQVDRDYQNTWLLLLRERDEAERTAEMARKKAAADAASKVAIDSNIALARTLAELRAGYDRLSAAERDNEHIGGVLIGRIKELDTQLKATDAATGRFQRNVGNYAGAISPLQRQLALIAGEFPNIQFGFRTFAASLSNQVQGVSEAIRETIAQNKLLRSEGKETTSVIKQIIGGFLNWQTGILLVAAVLPMLIERMSKGSKAAQDAEKAQKKYTEALNSADETERSSANEQIARLNTLTALAQDNAQSTRTRTLAIEELQRTYPTLFGNMSKQEILEGNLKSAIEQTTKALLDRAAAQAAEKKFAAASEKVFDLNDARRQQQYELNLALAKFNELQKQAESPTAGDALRNRYVRAGAEVERLRESLSKIEDAFLEAGFEQRRYLSEMQKNAAAAGDMFFGDTKTTDEKKKARKEKLKKELQDLAAVGTDIFTQLQQQLDLIGSEVDANTANAIEAVQKELDAGVISVAEYERRKKEIVAKGEREILELQVSALSKALTNYGYSEAVTDKVKQVYYDKAIALMKSETSEEEAQLIERAAIRGRFDEINEQNSKGKRKNKRDITKEEGRDLAIRAGMELLDAISDGVSSIYDAKIAKLQEINELIDKNLQDEVAAIGATTLTEEEKQRRIKEAEGKAQLQKEANEKKIAELKVRQARLDKAAAIANVIQATAVAIVNALKIPVYGPILAATYAATGAAQLAAIAARPIPKYEKGTKDSEGGPAIVSEKGSELVIEPDGSMWVTPPKESIVTLRKHSTVIPHDQLVQMTQRVMMENFPANTHREAVFDDGNIVDALVKHYDVSRRMLREIQKVNAYNKLNTKKTNWGYRSGYQSPFNTK